MPPNNLLRQATSCSDFILDPTSVDFETTAKSKLSIRKKKNTKIRNISECLTERNLNELCLENHWIYFNVPFLRWFGMHGIVLYPFILFALPQEAMYRELIQHELIHARQVQREGFFRFYITYVWEGVKTFFYSPKKNHRFNFKYVFLDGSFEKEAYNLEHVQLYDGEVRFFKQKFGMDMAKLPSESQWHSKYSN